MSWGLKDLFGGKQPDLQQQYTDYLKQACDATVLSQYPQFVSSQALQQNVTAAQINGQINAQINGQMRANQALQNALGQNLSGIYPPSTPKFDPTWVVQYHDALDDAKQRRFAGEC